MSTAGLTVKMDKDDIENESAAMNANICERASSFVADEKISFFLYLFACEIKMLMKSEFQFVAE